MTAATIESNYIAFYRYINNDARTAVTLQSLTTVVGGVVPADPLISSERNFEISALVHQNFGNMVLDRTDPSWNDPEGNSYKAIKFTISRDQYSKNVKMSSPGFSNKWEVEALKILYITADLVFMNLDLSPYGPELYVPMIPYPPRTLFPEVGVVAGATNTTVFGAIINNARPLAKRAMQNLISDLAVSANDVDGTLPQTAAVDPLTVGNLVILKEGTNKYYGYVVKGTAPYQIYGKNSAFKDEPRQYSIDALTNLITVDVAGM